MEPSYQRKRLLCRTSRRSMTSHRAKCLLTHRDATHPECLVVLFEYKEPNMWCCKVGGGDGDGGVHGGGWCRYTYDIGDYEVPGGEPPTKDLISSVAAVQGEIFFISSAEDMCAINFSSSTLLALMRITLD
ncbi:unnamed protein product [Miscanthus lutarioriparius]|uniref:Uncharacterized protein n=1 Tax=Miscanthus lutarioriparius TaxID=422564 RepID=A0A811QPK4_9POAL|nr:unnamed protein product [Miscanthus lutarioriparius]